MEGWIWMLIIGCIANASVLSFFAGAEDLDDRRPSPATVVKSADE